MVNLLSNKDNLSDAAKPTLGTPLALSRVTILPALIGKYWSSFFLVVLGLRESREVVPILSISYPLTYAFPGEIWTV